MPLLVRRELKLLSGFQGPLYLDIKYSLHAHSDFIKDIKAANARLKDSRSTLPGAPVDNSPPGGR